MNILIISINLLVFIMGLEIGRAFNVSSVEGNSYQLENDLLRKIEDHVETFMSKKIEAMVETLLQKRIDALIHDFGKTTGVESFASSRVDSHSFDLISHQNSDLSGGTNAYWASGFANSRNIQIYSKFNTLDACSDGSQWYGNDCWCSPGYKSLTGKAPCIPCGENTYSDQIGAARCSCNIGSSSDTGYDDGNDGCQPCPSGSTTYSVQSTQCICGSNIQYSAQTDTLPVNGKIGVFLLGDSRMQYSATYIDFPPGTGSWYSGSGWAKIPYLYSFYDQFPTTYSSRSGFVPCSQCPQNTGSWVLPVIKWYTCEYVFDWIISFPNAPCVCNPGYAGVVNATSGLNSCTKCGIGSSTIVKFETCVPTIAIAPGQSQCSCLPGYYSVDGYAPCTPCPSGSMGSSNKGYFATTCDVCMVGYYSSDGTPNAPGGCQKCEVGSSSTTVGGTSCPVCDIDYYSPNGRPPCSACLGSSTCGYLGQVACYCSPPQPTPTNSPASTPAPTVALTRRPTHPSPSPTSKPTYPGLCPVGAYSNNGREPCTPCSDGSSNNYAGSTTCDICLPGHYGHGGMPPCNACPEGFISSNDMERCFPCIGDTPCFASLRIYRDHVLGNITKSQLVPSRQSSIKSHRHVRTKRAHQTNPKKTEVSVSLS